MAFAEPTIHRVHNVTAKAIDLKGEDGRTFPTLYLTFIQRNGEQCELTVFFDAEHGDRPQAIASALTISQHPIREAAE